MDAADLELFERTVRHATGAHTGADLDAALDELGWSDALEDDPRAAVSVLFESQGATNATSSALDRVVLQALGLDGHRDGVGAVAASGAIVLPAIGKEQPPGDLSTGELVVQGIAGAAAAGHDQLVIVASTGDKDVAALVAADDLVLRAIEGIDPWSALVEVTGGPLRLAVEPEPTPERWAAARTLAHLALAHELVGASRTMLELAREHALERVQFGRPISAFQAVRHRLADTLVAIEAADAVLDAAWDDGTATSAAMAKAVAGRSARTTARHAQQVLAGIGFTTEHVLHRYIRRVLLLDERFGASRTLTKALGTDLIERRELPPVLPL